ncbi:MAG: hypothetical protein KJ607_14875 [Bacteroidetes bacterium]|nr:hypothetical protein [Bacteroidota bacterium]
MKLPRYQLKSSDTLWTFEFISEGPRGKIHKIIQYTETNLKDVYNLAFGDKDRKTGKIDDMIISNNSDSEKVLATVIASVYAFTDKYPDSYIYATGSTTARTRLYRMGISKYLDEVRQDFEIYGEINDAWEYYKKDIDYLSFLIKRKLK